MVKKKDNFNLAIISIVAIVAIIGLVIILQSSGFFQSNSKLSNVLGLAASTKPFGFFDAATCDYVGGWARDPNWKKGIDVKIYINGTNGKEMLLATTPADKSRLDLCNYSYIGCNHSFGYAFTEAQKAILQDGKSHTLYAYAIGKNSQGKEDGSKVLIGKKDIGICSTNCKDEDGDGYYAISTQCPLGDDCNDNSASINPGMPEICGDGIDNDCDGIIDCNKTMPILAWFSIPQNYLNPTRLNKMKEAGFTEQLVPNSFAKGYDNNYYPNLNQSRILELSKQAGLKVMMNANMKSSINTNGVHFFGNTLENVTTLINTFGNNPDVTGFFIWDEPKPELLGNQAGSLCYNFIQLSQANPNANIYVNLFPSYWPGFNDNVIAWGNYVDSFVNNCKPKQISFDYYPIRYVNQSSSNSDLFILSSWYWSLETIKKKSETYQLPWWGVILTATCTPPDDPFPVATTGHIRLQAFSDIVYGAQKIQYFSYTYWGNDCNRSNHPSDQVYSPLDANENPTIVWNNVKEVNQEIKGLSDVFVGAKIDKVMHYKDIPNHTTKFQPDSIVTSLTSNKPLIISWITNGDKEYIAIVNKDFSNNAAVTVGIMAKSYTFSLLPGDIKVFKYDKLETDHSFSVKPLAI